MYFNYLTDNYLMVLENQLLAPALKGVIDFDFVELATLSVTRFFAPFRVGANEENQ